MIAKNVIISFHFSAEKTFQKLWQFTQRGKLSNFTHPQLANIRQQAIVRNTLAQQPTLPDLIKLIKIEFAS